MSRLFCQHKAKPPVANPSPRPLFEPPYSGPSFSVTIDTPPQGPRFERSEPLTNVVPPVTPTPPAVEPKAPAGPLPIASKPFDEIAYLEANPDVFEAVANGDFISGHHHYQLHGHREKRQLRLVGPRPAPDAEVPEAQEDLASVYTAHHAAHYLAPFDLRKTTVLPNRIALVGSCFLQDLQIHERQDCQADLFIVNNVGTVPDNLEEYDLQIVQVHFRSVLPDATLWVLPAPDEAAHRQALEEARERLTFHLTERLEGNRKHGLLTFVCNFFTPQRNPLGVLQSRYDVRNIEYVVDQLNAHLETIVREHHNVYVLDVDRIAASLGRRFVQDDNVALFAHNSLMPADRPFTDRMEPVAAMSDYYCFNHSLLRETIWNEIVSMYRVVRQVDAVKLVVVDLDDTLWAGVSGDLADIGPAMVEGWPLGFAEALAYLKKRGLLLAILSKNDEARVREIWPKIFGNKLSLDDCAMVVINWQPKTANMQHILETVNLLPRNVVFIDDNPVERASMQAAFPDIRLLGRHPYYLRRVLLWSSETQVVSVTREGARRTEMIQAQVVRETQRKTLSREEFLAKAEPKVHLDEISSVAHPRFARVFELINKINQFNTTGKRWTSEEIAVFLSAGGRLFCFGVVDKFADYGLVGVVLVLESEIVQWVMSCRVLGLQVEKAVMATIMQRIAATGHAWMSGCLILTDVNFPCRDLFEKCGFAQTPVSKTESYWGISLRTLPIVPSHITLKA